MAHCQLSSISEKCVPSRTTEDITAIPEGRVGQVCKEWLIREDGNLAYHLQNEEITQHYEENRSKNRIVRQDLPIAKQLQQSELLEARRVRARHLKQETDNDEILAKQIERRLWIEEQKAKKAAEEADERLAKKLLEKEKARQLRKRLQKEKQQVERLSTQIGADYNLGSNDGSTLDYAQDFLQPTYQRILTEDDQELDLSEFCMPPPPGLTPEELKYFLEEQDAEIARLLQHQELKRSKNPEKEKLAVIEAQDYEIARMLQKQEKDRVRRIKEKLRVRQQKYQQEDESQQGNLHISETANYRRTSTPISPQTSLNDSQKKENEYDIPENYLVNDCDAISQTYEEPFQILSQQNEAKQKQNFYNIAIDLDPTYQRRIQTSQSNVIESCVDDDEVIQSNTLVEPNRTMTARSHDSSESAYRTNRSSDNSHHNLVTSTTSSRSSHGSSSSRHSSSNHSSKSFEPARVVPDDNNDDDYAPPLPPRDVSLLSRYKNDSEQNNSVNLLPPHHPQHPNRRSNESTFLKTNYSPNRSSLFIPSSNLPIPGQRRVLSMEKQKKDKNRNQDGCKTQ